MIIDVHSHVFTSNRPFSATFLAEASRARSTPIDMITRYADYRATAANCDVTICFGGKAHLVGLWVDDQDVADYVKQDPARLIGFLSLDPTQPNWQAEMEYGHQELGLQGIKLMPMYAGCLPQDQQLDPLWRYAQQHNLPVLLHTGTTFVSLASPGGWSCTTPAVGSGGTVNCSNTSFALSTANFTLVVEVDAATAPGTVISNTATAASTTNDPDSGDLVATDTVTVIAPADLEAAKTVSGATEPGGTVDYQIVIINNGPAQQGDYAGDELVDVLPAELILSGATASSGTVLVDLGTNTVTWNGVIPAGGTVTIDIMASIDPLAPIGATVSNQATINWDANGDGTNEASATTDDPTTGGGGDPTVFVVGGGNPVIDVPTLDPRALLALVLLIAAVAVFRLRT